MKTFSRHGFSDNASIEVILVFKKKTFWTIAVLFYTPNSYLRLSSPHHLNLLDHRNPFYPLHPLGLPHPPNETSIRLISPQFDSFLKHTTHIRYQII